MARGRSGGNWRKLVANQRAKQQPCWICRQPIDYNLPGTHDDGFTVDHIKPLSLHPEMAEEPSNLAACHRHCNLSRGNKAVKPALGNTSRNW
jgi:5-methylcytosine-specific restriction endonuclease McrA